MARYFWFKNLGGWENKAYFFYKFGFILALFFVIFGFFGWKTHLGPRCEIFLQKIIFEHENKFAVRKGLNIFYLKFVFLLMKKCISYNFYIWKLYNKPFFEAKLCTG